MAIFDFKSFQELMEGRRRNKIISIVLHSVMLLLCLIGSFVFIQDIFYEPTEIEESPSIIDKLSHNIWIYFMSVLTFIKIKIIIPSFIIVYFYYCITQNVFHNLFKDEYRQKYNQKYNKIHNIDYAEKKKSEKEFSLSSESEKEPISKSFTMNINKDLTEKEPESSLNMSMEMVKSMSRSMMGSLKSIPGSNLNQSMTERPNTSMRSSKIIQNIAKKTNEPVTVHGKDLMNLFMKGKNLSESFISQSSSGMEGDEGKIKIKAKKYYETINEKQGQEFKKWYLEAFLKYREQIKTENEQIKNYYYELSLFKKGIERELNAFLKEYREVYESLKECMMKYWKVKIEGFEPKTPLKLSNDLSNLFKESENKIINSQTSKALREGLLITEKELFKRCSSPRDFLGHLNQLKISLRNVNEKDSAEKELTSILSKVRYLNTLLNISCIEGELLGEVQTTKIKMIERCLNLLTANKIDIFSLYKIDTEFNDLDLFEEYDIETIKTLIELRTMILIYLVNKINLMSDQKYFKVKMSSAVTFDSGFLASTLQFFKNKSFAEIVCEKGTENIFSHFNLKIIKSKQGEEGEKERVIYCKPGLDNSICAAFFLMKEISEELNGNLSLSESLSYDEKRREKILREFVETFYICRRF